METNDKNKAIIFDLIEATREEFVGGITAEDLKSLASEAENQMFQDILGNKIVGELVTQAVLTMAANLVRCKMLDLAKFLMSQDIRLDCDDDMVTLKRILEKGMVENNYAVPKSSAPEKREVYVYESDGVSKFMN